MFRQAVWIQDISGLRAMIDPHLQILIAPFIGTGLTLDNVLLWVIREQLWKVYQLPIDNHFPKQYVERELHNKLTQRCITPSLHEITAHFIKVPRVYNDQALTVELQRYDLSIYYYLHKPLTYPS
jgi:hypothetical protein